MANKNICIECKIKPALYWGNSFCWECYETTLSYCKKPERIKEIEKEYK